MSLLTGFCGIVLVLREGRYVRNTWGEKSHRRCPGAVAGHECACTCHSGHEPWVHNEFAGHRPMVLPALEEPHEHHRFTEVKQARKKKQEPKKQETPPSAAVADMAAALAEMENDNE